MDFDHPINPKDSINYDSFDFEPYQAWEFPPEFWAADVSKNKYKR